MNQINKELVVTNIAMSSFSTTIEGISYFAEIVLMDKDNNTVFNTLIPITDAKTLKLNDKFELIMRKLE